MNTIFVIALQGQAGQGSALTSFLPLLLIIVVFYFFIIRPQMKKQKELKKFRDELKKGDKIVTTGGIYGKIVDIQEHTVIMEVENQVRLRIDKAAIIKDMSEAVTK